MKSVLLSLPVYMLAACESCWVDHPLTVLPNGTDLFSIGSNTHPSGSNTSISSICSFQYLFIIGYCLKVVLSSILHLPFPIQPISILEPTYTIKLENQRNQVVACILQQLMSSFSRAVVTKTYTTQQPSLNESSRPV